jgi:AcrR family transcriptional regulator
MREKIIKTALKHFATKGYEKTTLNEIAKELGISKPAIYYYFKSKQELYEEIFIHFFKDLEFTDYKDSIKNLNHYIDVMAKLFENRLLALLFIKELSNEGKNLTPKSLKIISKTLKYLSASLNNKINPFFIQTLIISSFTTYHTTIELRKKVGEIININSHFEIKDEIKKLILPYIKGKL